MRKWATLFWKKHLYQGLDPADGQPILDAFRQLAWIITPSSSLLAEAYQLAVANQRTVYDSLYLALSLREQCNFVTSDEKLVNSLSKSFQNLIWIGNWP
jgi:predicted nucleic acid-binding protein